MTGGSPTPASLEASFAARIGSFATTGTMRPRPTTSLMVLKVPCGVLPAGNCITCRSSFFNALPSARSAAATTTGRVGSGAAAVGTFRT
jgi:hypothetical protein